jgi:outer membrane lipoprotein carrier protein
MRLAITTAIGLIAALSLTPRAAEPTAAELAQALQKKYSGIKGFSADFVQTYRGGVLNKQLSERGRLLIKKPGKMRFEYTDPEKKLFVSDGVKIYLYVPQDKQVTVSNMPPQDKATTPVLFLVGKGDLGRDFQASFTELPSGSAAGSRALKLMPRTRQEDYDWLVIVVDPATLTLRGLSYGDPQGGTSSLSFTNLKENSGLADKEFDFKLPRGVDIITDASVR